MKRVKFTLAMTIFKKATFVEPPIVTAKGIERSFKFNGKAIGPLNFEYLFTETPSKPFGITGIISNLRGTFLTPPVEDDTPYMEAIADFIKQVSFSGSLVGATYTFQEEIKEPELRTIWLRVGGDLTATQEEMDALLGGRLSAEDTTALLSKMIRQGKFTPNGESYIPEAMIEDFNREYGTDYTETVMDFHLD